MGLQMGWQMVASFTPTEGQSMVFYSFLQGGVSEVLLVRLEGDS